MQGGLIRIRSVPYFLCCLWHGGWAMQWLDARSLNTRTEEAEGVIEKVMARNFTQLTQLWVVGMHTVFSLLSPQFLEIQSALFSRTIFQYPYGSLGMHSAAFTVLMTLVLEPIIHFRVWVTLEAPSVSASSCLMISSFSNQILQGLSFTNIQAHCLGATSPATRGHALTGSVKKLRNIWELKAAVLSSRREQKGVTGSCRSSRSDGKG